MPEGWVKATIGECCTVIAGQSPPGSSYNEVGRGVPFFQGKAEFGAVRPTIRKWTTDGRKFAKQDDVLLSVRAPVGPTNLAPGDCAIGRGLAAVRPEGGVDPRYVLHAFRASADELAAQATGSTFGAVTGDQVRAHGLLLPPLAEQRRIVAAIEEQFSRLDAASASLASARNRLTELEGRVYSLAVDVGRDRVLGDLLDRIEAGKSFKCETRRAGADEWGVIKVSAMTWGAFDPYENKTVVDARRADPRWEIRPGDLLLSRANTSQLVGAAVLVKETRRKLLLSDKSMRLITKPDVDKTWLRFALGSREVRSQMSAVATGTSDSMRNISQQKVKELRLRVPPPDEQPRIVAAIEQQLSLIESLRAAVDSVQKRRAALRRAILGRAFRGDLVPQDPHDESASLLLARIRTERDAALKPSRRKPVRT
jgi:type I restriction enzyme, S subunit